MLLFLVLLLTSFFLPAAQELQPDLVKICYLSLPFHQKENVITTRTAVISARILYQHFSETGILLDACRESLETAIKTQRAKKPHEQIALLFEGESLQEILEKRDCLSEMDFGVPNNSIQIISENTFYSLGMCIGRMFNYYVSPTLFNYKLKIGITAFAAGLMTAVLFASDVKLFYRATALIASGGFLTLGGYYYIKYRDLQDQTTSLTSAFDTLAQDCNFRYCF
jgi:hypothetical protein